MKNLFYLIALLSVSYSFSQLPQDTIPTQKLPEIIVTGSRVSINEKNAPKVIRIISQENIATSTAKSLDELIASLAGVDLLQRGPHGAQSDVSLRGGSFDQVAILLNGINLTNPQTGHYSMDIPLNLSDIHHIEVLEGSSSLAYGAGAFSGAINIITKNDPHNNLLAKIELGSHSLLAPEARISMRKNNLTTSLSAGYKKSNGHIHNTDYQIANLLLTSQLSFSHSDKLHFQFGINSKEYGANSFYSPAYPNQYDLTKGIFASIKAETTSFLKFSPQIYWSRHHDQFELIKHGTPAPSWYKDHNYHQSDVFGSNLNFQKQWTYSTTSFGAEIRNENILSSVLGTPLKDKIGKFSKHDSRTNISYFLEQNFNFSKLNLSLGAMLSQNSSIPNYYKLLPSIGANYQATNTLNIYTSYNEAMRLPTFTDLYYTTPTHIGNPNLLPEFNSNLEAGIKLRTQATSANAGIFYSKSQNVIDWLFLESKNKWQSHNLSSDASLSTIGFFTNTSLNLSTLLSSNTLQNLTLEYQYLSQQNNSATDNNPISMYTFNYLKHKLVASLNLRFFDNLKITPRLRFSSREGSFYKYTNLTKGKKTPFSPFTLLDCQASYKIKNFEIFLNANNILDTPYQDLGNIPQPRFWLSSGISFNLQNF